MLPLGSRVLSGQGDVSVGGIEALGQVDLGTFGGGDGQLRDTRVLPIHGHQRYFQALLAGIVQELGHHEASGTGTDQKSVGTGLGGDLLQAVHGAGSGLDEGGIDIANVVDLEQLALGVVALGDW